MPTYQYACTNPDCGNRFELVQSFTESAASECPVCGGPVRKVYGAVGVVFKGSGFYRTDSRKSADTASKSSESSGKSPAKESSSAGSDTSSSTTSSEPSTSSSSSSSKSSSSNSSSNSTPAKAAAPA